MFYPNLLDWLDNRIQQSWSVTRQQGFCRFVASRGTIVGATFAVAYLIGKWLHDYRFDLGHAAIALAISISIGWLVGALVWRRHEEYYQRLLLHAAKTPK